jgi:hypothetical protein
MNMYGEQSGAEGRTYEQVLEVCGGDIFLGLVGGEEAALADHLVAAPQQVIPRVDPIPILRGRKSST